MIYLRSNIVHFRKARNWTQQKLADALDIPMKRIGSYEEGRCEPHVELLIKMAELFGVSMDQLIKTDFKNISA
jgi:transcriptional regulator with XRE-family HTH domain